MDKTAQLRSIIELLSSSATKTEVTDAFAALIKFVKTLKESNAQEMALMKSAISMLGEKMKEDVGSDMSGAKKEMMAYCEKEMAAATKDMQKDMNKMMFEHDAMIAEADAKLDNVTDGKDADEVKIVAEVLSKIPAPKEVTADELCNKLEAQPEEQKLLIDAIKGLREELDELKKVKGRQFFGGGLARGVADSLYAPIGSAGATYETPTGTVNSSNTTFTVTATPLFVIVDGVTYFENNGYTLSGLTVTTSVPPTGFIRSAY